MLFDVGQTLIGPRDSFGRVYAEVLAGLGVAVGRDALERGIQSSMAEMTRRIPAGRDRYRHFSGGEREYWLRFASRAIEVATGRVPEPDMAETALDRLGAAFADVDAWRVFDDTRPALQALQQAGATLAVVSNWDSRLPRVLDLLELTPFFAAIGVSALEGVEKPDPAFFERVLARLDAEPAQALHVGDSPFHDHDGASAAGVDCVLIDRDATLDGDWPKIDTLTTLVDIATRGLTHDR